MSDRRVILRDGKLFCPDCGAFVDIVEVTRMSEILSYSPDIRIDSDGVVRQDYTDGKTFENRVISQEMVCEKDCGWLSDAIEIG